MPTLPAVTAVTAGNGVTTPFPIFTPVSRVSCSLPYSLYSDSYNKKGSYRRYRSYPPPFIGLFQVTPAVTGGMAGRYRAGFALGWR